MVEPAPGPVVDVGNVGEVLADVGLVLGEPGVAQGHQVLPAARADRRAAKGLLGEVEPAHPVEDDHVERRGRRALLGEATHVEAAGVRAAVDELVHGPRVAVEREDDVSVGGEEVVELAVGVAVGVVCLREKGHQVDDVDEAEPQVGHVPVEQLGRGEGLLRRHVTGAGEDDVGGLAGRGRAGPLPDAGALGAVPVGLLEGEVLQVLLLVDDDEVDVVGAAQAVVGDRQGGVGVRRQPDPHDVGGERDEAVDETRALVREAVVVVAPARRGEQHVERGHRRPPRQGLGVLEPLDVLDGHRRRHHGEGLVRREDTVPAGEEIALQPALAQVLAEHLHHPTVRPDSRCRCRGSVP